MKAIYKHIAIAALALSAVACSQDDDFAPSYLNDPDAVRITAQVGTNDVTGGFTRSNPHGDATAQAQFNSGDQISVTAGTQAPVTYQLGTDGWNPVGENYLKWEANEMNVTAYYPVGKNNASATTFTVPTSYTDENPIADADYMTYSGTQSKGDDKSINLTMERKMVRIVITPDFNDQFPEEDYAVTDITVHGNTTGYADGEPVEGDIEVAAYEQGGVFYALLAPTTEDNGGTFLTVTVKNGTTSQSLTLTVKGIPATTAGNSYAYSLTVGKDVATVSAVSVNDWTGGTIPGGTAEVILVTSISGTTAKISVSNGAAADDIQAAIANALDEGCTTLEISFRENPTDEMVKAISTAIVSQENKIDLILTGGVTSIGNEAFWGCSSLSSITLPESVTSIGTRAFRRCTALASVKLPNKLTSIGTEAFLSCGSLTTITLPDGVTSIGDKAFSECSSLSSITLPEGVTSIGRYAFSECSRLSSISLPASLVNIGDFLFATTPSLTKIKVNEENEKYMDIDGVLYSKDDDGTTLICYPAGKNTSSFTLPAGITSIKYYAFLDCTALTSITIPASVTQIGIYAFYNCSSLAKVVCEHECKDGETDHPTLGYATFEECAEALKIYVPASSVESYKTAWSDYASKIVAISEE